MRRYSTDPNSPDNPHSPYYKPTHIYEMHITHGGGPVYKPTQTQAEWVASPQPNMGYAESEVSVTLTEKPIPKSSLPATIDKATLKLTFTGKARTKDLMTRTFFNANGKFKKFQFQSDIKSWLGSFGLSTSPVDPTTGSVTATLTSPASANYTSASTSVEGQNITMSATTTIDGNQSSISFSHDQPFTIVFTFEPKPVKGEYNQTDFEGTLEVELSVTYYPTDRVSDTEAEGFLITLGFMTGMTGILIASENLTWIAAPAIAANAGE